MKLQLGKKEKFALFFSIGLVLLALPFLLSAITGYLSFNTTGTSGDVTVIQKSVGLIKNISNSTFPRANSSIIIYATAKNYGNIFDNFFLNFTLNQSQTVYLTQTCVFGLNGTEEYNCNNSFTPSVSGAFTVNAYLWNSTKNILLDSETAELAVAEPLFDISVIFPNGYRLSTPTSLIRANITVKNMGTATVDAVVNYSIINKNHVGQYVVALDPDESDTRTITITTPSETGIYTFAATVSALGYSVLGSDTFTVYSAEVPPTGLGGGGGAVTEKITPAPKFEKLEIVEYPPELQIKQGDIKYIEVQIWNRGNATAKNSNLTVQGIPESWILIEPEKTDIEAGKTQTFIVKFKIPFDAPAKDYPIKFVAASLYNKTEEASALKIAESVPTIIRLKDIITSRIVENQRGTIEFILNNTGNEKNKIKIWLEYPEQFLTDKNIVEDILNPGEEKTYKFILQSNETGTFVIKSFLTYEGGEIRKDILLNVYSEPKIIAWAIVIRLLSIILLIIAAAVAAAFFIYKKRKAIKLKIRIARGWLYLVYLELLKKYYRLLLLFREKKKKRFRK